MKVAVLLADKTPRGEIAQYLEISTEDVKRCVDRIRGVVSIEDLLQ